MKKRILGALLCLILLISLLPVTALAATQISLVRLNVTIPEHGRAPEKPTLNTDGVTLYAHEWYHNGDPLSWGSTFEGGETYTLKVRLSTLDEFKQDTSVTVNGRAAMVLSVDNNSTGLLFSIDFYVTPLGYKLSFDPGYGSGTMTPMTGQNSYILPPCTFTAPSGKEFGYWLNEETNDEYQPGENIFLSKDTTVRAVWRTGSGKTKIYDVEATSNIASIATLYGSMKSPTITVTKGAPARILTTAGNLSWQKKINGVWEYQNNSQFTAGEWRIATQVRIDNNDATQYELGTPVTLKVDGVQWTAENNGTPSVHHDYSMIFVYSPVIVIEDNPNVRPPESITKVTINISGYKLGANADDVTATCDQKGVLVVALQFLTAEDNNNDGIPESTKPVQRFESGVPYMVSFSLKAKDGYSLSALGMTGVTINNTAALGAYSTQDECYSGFCEVAPLQGCTVSFNAGGGKGTMSAVTVEKGTYTLPQNGFTAPEGKKFKTWSVGDREYAPGTKISIISSITVTAVWEELPAEHTCKPEPVAKVAPTCTEDGKESYYTCKDCGKFYEDAAGTKEITDLSAWGKLDKLGHADKNQDGKCDACGLALTDSTEPISPTETTTPAAPDEPADATEPTIPNGDGEKDPPDTSWIWIALGAIILCAAAVITVLLVVKKKKIQ